MSSTMSDLPHSNVYRRQESKDEARLRMMRRQYDQRKRKESETWKVLAGGTLAVAIVMGVAVLLVVNVRDATKPVPVGPYKETAVPFAQYEVSLRLKAPATARFQPLKDQGFFTTGKEREYCVEGYVDAQNSFGALIRTKYKVYLHWTGKRWQFKYFKASPVRTSGRRN